MKEFTRSAGVLLNISSLPSPYGIGGFGRETDDMCDFLLRGGFHYWQILPLNTVGLGDSPYSGTSAFAGNYLYIDPEKLAEDGAITRADAHAAEYPGEPYSVDYAFCRASKRAVVRKAFESGVYAHGDIEKYRRDNAGWLDDYALYMSVKDMMGGLPWWRWDEEYLRREKHALDAVRESEEYAYYVFEQFLFDRQWAQVRKKLASRGISIIGDMPMYVSHDSADVWAHPDIFRLDKDMNPAAVAGVPPDYFSADGQLWGNPLYDIERLKKTGYKWWLERLERAMSWYDVLRIDHFRAFSRYWSVPAGSETAREGKWEKGLGMEFLKKVFAAMPEARFIAEDLGIIDDGVRELLQKSGLPGMRVMQFGFEDGDSIHLPHNFDRFCIGYTATHDNNTTLGWLQQLPENVRDYVLRYIRCNSFGWSSGGYGCKSTKAFYRKLAESSCVLAIVPFQDMCGFGADCRMNTPGVADGNWKYRATYENLEGVDCAFFNEINSLYGRNRS